MELNDRLSFCPCEMAGAGRDEGEGARGELVTARLLEFLADAQDEGALHDGHVLVCWVPMWRNTVPIWHLDTQRKRPWLRWITFESGRLSIRRQRRWTRRPLRRRRRDHDMGFICFLCPKDAPRP